MNDINFNVFDLENIVEWLSTTGLHVVLIIIVAVIVHWLLSLGVRHLTKRIQAMDNEEDSPLDRRAETVSSLVKTTGLVVIITVAVLMIMDQVGLNIGPILASVGVVSLALGLGAQTLVKDIIGGLFIILEDQFHIGDVIDIDGHVGTVENMTLRVTMVRDLHGTLHFIPNGEIRIVANRSRDWGTAVIDVGITYKDDVDKALALLESIGLAAMDDSEYGQAILEPPTVTGVEGLEDWQVRIRLMVKTEAGQQWNLQRYLRARIREEFPANDITIAAPRQEIVLVQDQS